MIDLDSQIQDRYSYPLVDPDDRWIYNKLILAETLGYKCGPSGTPIPDAGTYILRPIYNCAGYGYGGFIKFEPTREGLYDHIPGWFWCEWFEGRQEWIDFTDDVPVDWTGGMTPYRGNKLVLRKYAKPMITVLPEFLQGFSKHLTIEHIGGNIIEASPRHQEWLNEETHLSDYILKTAYRDEEHVIHYMTGHYWEEIPKE